MGMSKRIERRRSAQNIPEVFRFLPFSDQSHQLKVSPLMPANRVRGVPKVPGGRLDICQRKEEAK